MAANRIRVTTPGGDYDIWIKPGLLQNLTSEGDLLGRPYSDARMVVVTNTTLAPLYGEVLANDLDAALVTIPDGEQYKTLATVAKLYTDFVAAGLDRSGTVIALGGGVVGDTAGFAAATYMRGVRLVQIPTTLLSMVDSSVGGKVGVDLPQGKNLVGAFKQPDVVLMDTDVLQTLPERELHCGMAEVIKHGLLADEGLLELIEAVRTSGSPLLIMPEMVRRAVQVKVGVVQQDPYEKNIRAHLNLGHTFGHAIEQVSGYVWPHGEAVGIGLLAAARLSAALGLAKTPLAERVQRILTTVGLPTRIAGLDTDAIFAAMGTDKKWQSGRSRFVLLRGVGQPLIVEEVPRERVMAVLNSLQ